MCSKIYLAMRINFNNSILILVLLTFGKLSTAQNDLRYILTDGIAVNVKKDILGEFYQERGYGMELGYFLDYRFNKKFSFNGQLGFSYFSADENFPKVIYEIIQEPDFRYAITSINEKYKLRFLTANISLKFQYFPFKKLPLLFSVGIKPAVVLANSSSVSYKSDYSKSNDNTIGGNHTLMNTQEFENSGIDIENHMGFMFGILGYRNSKFSIESYVEFNKINYDNILNENYSRMALVLNYAYYLNFAKIENENFKEVKRRKK